MKTTPILALIPIIYALSGIGLLSGFSVYLIPSILWLLLFLALFSYEPALREYSKGLVLLGLAIGLLHMAIVFNVALMTTGLGRTPYSLTPLGLVINTFLVYSRILGVEFSRALIINRLSRRPVIAIAIATLVFSLIAISPQSVLALKDAKDAMIFLASRALPLIAQSALASYLVLIGGPWTSIAYMAVIESVMHYSPYLPSMNWMMSSLVGVIAPIIGFIAISMAISSCLSRLRRSHIKLKSSIKRSSSTLIAIGALLLLMWAFIGAFGVKPILIVGSSMKPTMDMGDIAIVGKASPSSIKPGDIIQYYHEHIGLVVHRVVDVIDRNGELYFITKGDAMRDPDPWLVSSNQVLGKVVYVIPKIGWVAIAIKVIPNSLSSIIRG